MKLNIYEKVYAYSTTWCEEILYRYPVTIGFVIGLIVGATVI